jgi:predicted GH43/DUF377 family glycosyl hydrolase
MADAGDDAAGRFDPAYYLRENPDVAANPDWSRDPRGHYLAFGRREGRRPYAGAPRPPYADGRPSAVLRLEARDRGVVLRFGDGPERCDELGAREAIVFESGGKYFLHYDGAGPKGWRACLATSPDLIEWKKQGPILEFGAEGEPDAACACSPWVHFDGSKWHMFYLGTRFVSPPPDLVPSPPYVTCKAESAAPGGPWKKRKDIVPFRTKADSYYSHTASPGDVLRHGDEYLMFFSAATGMPFRRTLGIARTRDLDGPWQVDPEPIVPLAEQIENSSLYREATTGTWFLFTNHVGVDARGEYTDAVWVYWSRDPNRWDASRKAVVLDGLNCSWSPDCIGMPSVIRVKDRLAILYDAPGGKSVDHMRRHIALAWLDLPLATPRLPEGASESPGETPETKRPVPFSGEKAAHPGASPPIPRERP